MSDDPKPNYPEPQHFPDYLPEVIDDDPETPGIQTLPQGSFGPVEFAYQPERFACVRCGSTNLARGMIVDYGEKFEQVRFAPRRISLSWLNSLFNLRPWRALLKLDAVACRDCGAVQLVVDPSDLRRAERFREE